MKLDNYDNYKLKRFLLVEDDDDHAKIITRTLAKENLVNSIDRVIDGVEAIKFLKKEGEYQKVQTPELILLDLKLPKKNGLEVLKEIKEDDSLKLIPVLILTTSDHESDKLKAYQGHVNSYLVKPMDTDLFKKMVEDINFYWRVWNRLPSLSQPAHSSEKKDD